MSEEQLHQLTDIYDEAIRKLSTLQIEKQHIINDYIKELETQKIAILKKTISSQ